MSYLRQYLAKKRQAAELIEALPKVTKTELAALIQPCDILLTRPNSRGPRTLLGHLWLRLSSWAQACQYCSAKIYLGNDLVAGFGFRQQGKKAALRSIRYQKFLSSLDSAVLIRVPGLTSGQQEIIQNYIQDNFGKLFHWPWVIRSFLRRYGPGGPDAESPHRRTACQGSGPIPLSCSTLIAIPLSWLGIVLAADPTLVWPIDLLLSPLTQKMCRLEEEVAEPL